MKLRFALLLLAAPGLLSAEVRPTPGVGDPRLQTVQYDPEQVTQLQVAMGYQLTVEFGPDERIENVAVGDSGTWQVTPNKRGDHLFIKVTQSGAPTNMTVVTDTRTYNFVLTSSFGGSPDTAFTVRFLYAPAVIAPIAGTVVAAVEVGRYHLSGSRGIRPSAIDDDGIHTYIEWSPRQAMPAVFTLDSHDQETLINGMVRDNRYVIDSVANRLVFRLDQQIAYATRKTKLAMR